MCSVRLSLQDVYYGVSQDRALRALMTELPPDDFINQALINPTNDLFYSLQLFLFTWYHERLERFPACRALDNTEGEWNQCSDTVLED
jgi:hypothetical protein